MAHYAFRTGGLSADRPGRPDEDFAYVYTPRGIVL